mmetsp:Transcript_17210/g.39774  ORF Transcript_17210/g.39774 Transcript_17210/m.39774 type:complete len:208 (-) Transcript_17210:2075-2698(-)
MLHQEGVSGLGIRGALLGGLHQLDAFDRTTDDRMIVAKHGLLNQQSFFKGDLGFLKIAPSQSDRTDVAECRCHAQKQVIRLHSVRLTALCRREASKAFALDIECLIEGTLGRRQVFHGIQGAADVVQDFRALHVPRSQEVATDIERVPKGRKRFVVIFRFQVRHAELGEAHGHIRMVWNQGVLSDVHSALADLDRVSVVPLLQIHDA